MSLTNGSAAGARVRYREFLVPSWQTPAERYDVLGFPHTDVFRDRLRHYFGQHAELNVLEIWVADESIGYVTRERINRPDGTAGDTTGDSQGATLPGESTGYRAVWFVCREHTPPIWLPMAYYDLRYRPDCPQDAKHQAEYVS